MIGCSSCGAHWTQQERIAVQVAELRALGAAIGDHEHYGRRESGVGFACWVMKKLGTPAFAMAIMEALS